MAAHIRITWSVADDSGFCSYHFSRFVCFPGLDSGRWTRLLCLGGRLCIVIYSYRFSFLLYGAVH